MDILKVSWEAYQGYCEELAEKIRQSNFQPDKLVAISRGGLVPARLLADFLDIRNIHVIGVGLYSGIGKQKNEIRVVQDIGNCSPGEKILIVDDIADSGRTLEFVKNHLAKKSNGTAEIKIATVHFKPGSKVIPDYFVQKTTAWIEYPYEAKEIKREIQKQETK